MAKDKLGVIIQPGATVLMPDPNETDLHNHSFAGTVSTFRNGNIVVDDGEGDSFEIEPERVEVIYTAD